MRFRGTKEEEDEFNRIRDERMPAVLEASRRLQAAMDIDPDPGVRMVGVTPATRWELPEPPEQTVTEMFASLEAKLTKGAAKTAKKFADYKKNAQANEQSGNNQEEKAQSQPRVATPMPRSMMKPIPPQANTFKDMSELKHNLRDSTLTQKNNASSTAAEKSKIPEIVIDPADSPPPALNPVSHLPRLPWAPEPSTSISNLFENLLPQPASPTPSFYADWRNDGRGIPGYWYHHLSDHVNRWLEQTDVTAYQTILTRLDLRTSSINMPAYHSVEDKDYSQIKFIRLTLPSSVSPSQLHEWLVFDVEYKNQPHQPIRDDFWMLAFPVQAITTSRTEPFEMRLPRTKGQKSQVKKGEKTILRMGTKGKSPILHGRGYQPQLIGFMEACAKGEAVVEFQTFDVVAK